MKIEFVIRADVTDDIKGDINLSQGELEELMEEIEIGITESFMPCSVGRYSSIRLSRVEVSEE